LLIDSLLTPIVESPYLNVENRVKLHLSHWIACTG